MLIAGNMDYLSREPGKVKNKMAGPIGLAVLFLEERV